MTSESALVVAAEVHGQRVTLQLDTGADQTTLTPAAWKRLGLPRGKKGHAAGAGGEVTDVQVVPVRTLRVAGRELQDIEVAVMELGDAVDVDGVLGQDVLGRFIADVDIPARHITLHDRASSTWRSADLVGVPYTITDQGLIRIEGKVDTTPAAIILDLGAGASIASTLAAPGATSSNAAALGADGTSLELSIANERRVAIGDYAFPAAQLYVSDLPVFALMHLDNQPAVILGMDRLATCRLVIDPDQKRLYLSRQR